MSRRRREGLSPSLFPFLAVLVCTLGTLILFLALVAQNATDAAEQNSRAERLAREKLQAEEEEPVTQRLAAAAVDSMIAEERFRVEQFVSIRASQTADVEDRRDQLTYLEEQTERLRVKLKRLSDEVDNATGETIVENIEQEAIEAIRAQVKAERDAVENLRGQSNSKTPRVVIVPHKGPNGTDRRAVYLECTDQGITIWPEGSRITMAQLEASRSANPLDAALRVIRMHVMKHYGDTVPPYPLLVVRPDGVESYGAARTAMRDWDDQFGYELVPADVQLAFSRPDANLRQRVEVAIRDAAARQNQQHSFVRDQRRGGGGSGGRFPTLSAASLDRAGRAGGFRSHRAQYTPSSPRTGQSPYTGSSPYSASGQATLGDKPANRGTFDNGNADASARQLNDEMRTAAREIRDAQHQNGSHAGGGSYKRSEFPDLPKGPDTPSGADPQKSARQQSNPYAATNNKGESNDGELTSDVNESRSSSNSGPSDRAPLRDPTGSSPWQRQSESSGQVASKHPGGSGGSANAPSSAAMMSPQARQSNSSAFGSSTSAAPPQADTNASSANPSVGREGRDWALPPQMVGMGGNAIVRTIRTQCYQDRFVLMPPVARGMSETFQFSDGDIDQASLRLATAVRDRIDRWGAALPGGRWQPRLEIEVMPDSEHRFRQLQTLMRGSGVEITGRASQ
jgi:hypothetical protein